MGGICSTQRRDEKYIQNFSQKPKGKDHSEEMDAVVKDNIKMVLG
jgi:hypothetical protein